MKGGILFQKKEMTKVWKDGKQQAVTLLTLVPQKVVRYKTLEKDGYAAVVVGAFPTEKDGKVSYRSMCEFAVDAEFEEAYGVGADVSLSLIEGVDEVTVRGVSKGKGFQGAMKRFHLKGGPKTHGSKFHRQVGSLGNRKPRRVQKGHPHAGRMGGEQITLKHREVLGVYPLEGESVVGLKGSVPGSYNSIVTVFVK